MCRGANLAGRFNDELEKPSGLRRPVMQADKIVRYNRKVISLTLSEQSDAAILVVSSDLSLETKEDAVIVDDRR